MVGDWQLPLVGEPDVNGFLNKYCTDSRVQDTPERGNHVQAHQACVNLYLYGTESPGQNHVIPKVQGMINAFVQRAASNPPVPVVKSRTIADGGPLLQTTSGEQVTLDSVTAAEYVNTILEAVLKRSRYEKFFRDMAFYARLLGWQDALFEKDNLRKACNFRVIPPLQWYKDPVCSEIEDMSHVGLDWPVDANWAKRAYPELADVIDQVARKAIQFQPGNSGYSTIYQNIIYAAPVVTMSFWWIRNRQMKMTDQEGIAAGILQAQQLPGVTNEPDGTSGSQPSADVQSQPTNDAQAGIASPMADGSGGGGMPPQPDPAPMREALILTATGQEVTENSPEWPAKLVTSQTIQLENRIVEDKVCEYWDIPLISNFNVRIPFRPYGQSDCIRVRTIQADRNAIHASAVNHANWFKGPTTFSPKSIYDSIPEGMKNMGMTPAAWYWIEDDAWHAAKALGQNNLFEIVNPPALPPVLVTMGQELDAAFDTSGGQTNVSQGEAPTANASGELANTLLQASYSSTDFTSLYLEEMTYRTAMLTLHYILTDFTAQDLMAINRTYDIATTELIRQTILTMEFDIELENRAQKEQEKSQVRADFAAQLIDPTTAQEALGYDPEQIQKRQQEIQQQQMMAQAAVAGAQGSNQQLTTKPGDSQPAGNRSSLKHPAAA